MISKDIPKIAMLILSLILVTWAFGSKTTFYYLLTILFGIILSRKNEINELFIKDIVNIFDEEE